MRTLKLGTVPYLNVEPFLMALHEVVPCEVFRRHPSGLLALSRRTALDACMLPAVDLLEEGVEPLRGASISSDGPVRSVLLLAETRPSSWSHVALDPNSRTSNELARLLTDTVFGGVRRYQAFEDPQLALQSGSCDAAVLIGDRALRASKNRFLFDLGSLWRDVTDLPFVYAAWARGSRRAVPSETLEAILDEARRGSQKFIDRCVDRASREWRLEAERVQEYLRESISYRFGFREREGLREFRDRLRSRQPTSNELVGAGVGDVPSGGRP